VEVGSRGKGDGDRGEGAGVRVGGRGVEVAEGRKVVGVVVRMDSGVGTGTQDVRKNKSTHKLFI
jgi:hypothetical protein